MPHVFLSYRRRDNDHALSIYLWLIKRYGRESVFWDRKDIDAGRDFSEVITQGIDKCALFMALIGPEWLGEVDAKGRRKIDSDEDWVRREIHEALERGIPVLPVLGSGASMPAAKDLPADLERFARLQALSMADMRFYPLLSDSLAQAGIRGVEAAGGQQSASRVVLWAGALLKRQAERLQIRAKELIREGQTGRALEELNEGTELMMALLDFVPGEQALDVQMGYIYGALAQEFDGTSQPEMASRYRDLQLGILKRVKDDLSAVDYLTGNAASAIKGEGEVYAGRGEFDKAIEYYRKALEIEPTYQYAWHDLFAAYDGLARKGRVDLDEMRLALQKTREFSAGAQPGTQVPGLGLAYLDSLEATLHHWEQTAAEYPHLIVGAEQRYTAAISEHPDNAESHYQRARARAANGNNAGAIEDYSAAIALGKEGPSVYLERAGLEFFNNEDWRRAEQDFTAAIERGSTLADTYYYRGRCRLVLENFVEAETDFGAAIERGHTEAFGYRGGARLALGDFTGAELDLSKVIEVHPEKAELYEVRALARQQKRDYAGAAADYASAVAKGLDKAEALFNLGKMQVLSGEAAPAEESLTSAIAGGYEDAAALFWRGRARLDQQNSAAAETDFGEAIKRGYDDADIYFQRGNARLFQADITGAADDFTAALEKGYAAPVVYYLRAVASQIQGNSARTLADCSEAIARGVTHAEIYRMRVYAAVRLGNFELAEEDRTRATEIEPGHPFELASRGDLHLAQGEYEPAMDSYRAALQSDAQVRWRSALQVRWRFALALTLLLSGRLDEAEAEYAEGIRDFNPLEAEIAAHELDHWTGDQPVAPEVVARVRQLLDTSIIRPHVDA